MQLHAGGDQLAQYFVSSSELIAVLAAERAGGSTPT
jgi:hypothetical protein